MNHKLIRSQALAVSLLLFFTACTKLDTTQLGRDLIPAVDNINTFELFLPVVANSYIVDDSTRLNSADAHVVGGISNDALFGSSKASMFFELKPNIYPYEFGHKDSIKQTSTTGFDSAVLILSYVGYYGDSSAPVTFKLYEVDKKMQFDTLVRPNYDLKPNLAPNMGKFWGQKTMAANQFNDSIPIKRGDSVYQTVINQLRIPLDQTKARELFYKDSIGGLGSDSLFKTYLPGFALVADASPQTLFYFKLGSSKIEFYYRENPSKPDTVSATFGFTALCGHATKFERNRSGAELNNWLAPNLTDGNDQVYIQTTPGVSAALKIKGLDTLSNKLIHRAELRVTQLGIPTGIESQLEAPPALYLDIKDSSGTNKYRGIPYDLSPFIFYYCYPTQDIEFGYFGGISKKETVAGDLLTVYRFNISRFVQGVISRNENPYELRLSAPFYNFYEDCSNSSTAYPRQVFPFTYQGIQLDQVGQGRIRVAGGGPNVNADVRMQVRIIYSKL